MNLFVSLFLIEKAEPIGGPTRPSSAMFAYPNLQTLGTMGMGTLGGMSMQSTMQQMHQTNTMAPPVPLPRYECVFLNFFKLTLNIYTFEL